MRKTSIGGMALIEGVMMKNDTKIAIAVRKPDATIVIESYEYNPWFKKMGLDKIPFLRGVFALVDSMVTGIRSLNDCTKYIDFEEGNGKSEKESKGLSNVEMTITVIVSIALSIGIFFVLPNVITNYIFPVTNVENRLHYNLLEAVLKLSMFVLYVFLISRLKDIKRVFMYHGAEHKTIATYEAEEELTVENVKKHTRFHPRCGTSFMLLVLVISMIIFYFIWFPNFYLKLFIKLLCLPIIAGISYEAIRLTSKYSNQFWAKILMAPGMFMQRLTTKEPDNEQIEVAIASFNEALGVTNSEKE